MLTARDIKSLREKHNAHLLDEIVAVQPFVIKNSFTGCGLFETEFERKGRKRTSPATLATYELLRWPEEEVKWSQACGSSCVDSFTRPSRRAGEISARQRRRNGSAKRVHGILHRLLATTTKQIVGHVEREVCLLRPSFPKMQFFLTQCQIQLRQIDICTRVALLPRVERIPDSFKEQVYYLPSAVTRQCIVGRLLYSCFCDGRLHFSGGVFAVGESSHN